MFSAGTGTIENEDDFLEIIEQPGDVKIVESINWCRRRDPNAAGCARLNDSFIVEAGHATDIAGPLWAHEFGHVSGLAQHRIGQPLMTMNETVTRRSRRVDRSECAAYRR